MDNGIEGKAYNALMNAKAENFIDSNMAVENKAKDSDYTFKPCAVIRLNFLQNSENPEVGEFRLNQSTVKMAHMFCYARDHTWIVRNRMADKNIFSIHNSFPGATFWNPAFNNLKNNWQQIQNRTWVDNKDTLIAGWVIFK